MATKITNKKVMVFSGLFLLALPFCANAATFADNGQNQPLYCQNVPLRTANFGYRHYCYFVPGQWIFRPVYHQPAWVPPHRQCYFYYP